MTAEEVAQRISRHAALLSANGGGITFSGGEALSQAKFALAVRKLLPGMHACIETSGYAPAESYQQVARQMDLVIQDIKLLDPAAHRYYTGVDNAMILHNVCWLVHSGIPFRIRVPLIPTVNDNPAMMEGIVHLLEGAHALEKVELLPYNTAAGAKYAGLSMDYQPQFPVSRKPNIPIEPFKEAGIPCDIL